MPRYSRAFHSILTKTLKDILLLLPDTVKCHYNQCFRPPFSQKNVDKKGNFSENLVKTKRQSVSTVCVLDYTDCLINRLINLCLKLMIENASYLTENTYLEHIKRVKFCKILNIFEKNVD